MTKELENMVVDSYEENVPDEMALALERMSSKGEHARRRRRDWRLKWRNIDMPTWQGAKVAHRAINARVRQDSNIIECSAKKTCDKEDMDTLEVMPAKLAARQRFGYSLEEDW